MLNILKFRSDYIMKLKEIAPLELTDYRLDLVAIQEEHGHNTIEIEYLAIDSSIQNKGLGKAILNVMIESLFDNGVDCLVITATDLYGTDFNKLVCLYKSLGFKEIKGGVAGCMYRTNSKSSISIQQKAKNDMFEASRLQQSLLLLSIK